MKEKNQRKLKIAISAFILLGYILGFSAVFNLKNILGVGHYRGYETFSTSMEEGSGGMHLEIFALHSGQLYHQSGYVISTFSEGDLTVLGISYAFYRFEASSSLRQYVDTNFSTPRKSLSYDYRLKLPQNTNLTLWGYVDMIFRIGGINETHRIPFEHGIIIELDGEQINYEWGNISTWLNTIYLSFTVIPLGWLYRNVKAYKFEKWYSDETKERDERFFKIISKESEE